MKDTRTRFIETTARLLLHRGYHGTSLGDVLKESGAPKGSLYFHFPEGKDQLVVEATKFTVSSITANLKATLSGTTNPATAVRTYFEATADSLVATDYAFGCPIAPLVLDGIGDLPEVGAVCRAAFKEWADLLEQHFVGAGINSERARRIAILAQATIEGVLLMCRAEHSTAPLNSALPELLQLIEDATPPRAERQRLTHSRGGQAPQRRASRDG